MKLLTVAAAIFASTSLAVPTNNHNGGGACVPRPGPGNSNTSSAPGGNPTGGHTSSGPGTKPTDGNTSSGPGTKPTGGHSSSGPGTKPTGGHTSSGPGTKPTGGHTSSGPGTKPTGGHTSSGPGTKPTSSHTNSVPATTTTGSNTGSHTSPGSSTTSTGHPGSGGGFQCPAGLYSNLQCCSTDVLGVLGLDCSSPSSNPTSGDDFISICAAVGQQAQCCVLPVAGQDVLCQNVIPGGPVSSGNGGNPTGGHPTSVPGGNPTSVPGGNPTSVPGDNPTSVPGDNNPLLCPDFLYSNPQCCSTDVLGILDLDCSSPGRTATSGDFKSTCAAAGKQAKCCVIPVAGQDVLCQDPIPAGHPTSVPGGHPTSAPGGNPTSAPGGNPTSAPGGNPTPVPGGNPTPVPGHPAPPSGGNNPFTCPPGLYSNLQCCSTNILGLADLDCSTPSDTPTSADNFKSICAAVGQQPMCCVIPVAGQALFCQQAIGA